MKMRFRDSVIFMTAAVIAAAVLLSSCQASGDPTGSEVTDTGTVGTVTAVTQGETATADTQTADGTKTSEKTAELPYSRLLAEELMSAFPKTDGSTSAIPLDAAVRAGVFGISADDAEKDVVHTTSHDSYYNLLSGECDFVYCHLLSKEQYDAATERGISVELTPIAREGFIFLVSRDNPIDSLTTEQIKKIYSGEITSWAEVGGDDIPIIAYQRNIDSGSQNYMRVFMGDTPLADAPTVLRPASMNALVDAVAAFDGSGGSIGYSVFSYVGGMYDADGGVKILKIDGTQPTFGTIADGTYPCTGYNYAVIRAGEPENSPARNLLAYILTDEGQNAIAATGYFAPLNPTANIDITIRDFNLMTDVGTGKETFEPSAWYYTAKLTTEQYDNYNVIDGFITANGYRFSVGEVSYPVTGHAELDLQVKEYVFKGIDEVISGYKNENIAESGNLPRIHLYSDYTAINGYLSVSVGYGSTAVWDIETGKRLSLSDMFREGTTFVGKLNKAIRERIDLSGEPFVAPADIKHVFEGIEAGFNDFGINEKGELTLNFSPDNNRYFANKVTASISPTVFDGCLITERRDMSAYADSQSKAYFANNNTVLHSEHIILENEYSRHTTGEYRWTEIVGYAGSDKINDAMREYMSRFPADFLQKTVWSDEMIEKIVAYYGRNMCKAHGLIDQPAGSPAVGPHGYIRVSAAPFFLGNSYVIVNYSVYSQYLSYIGFNDTGIITDAKVCIYDLETGEEVGIETVLPHYDKLKERLTDEKYFERPNAPIDSISEVGEIVGIIESYGTVKVRYMYKGYLTHDLAISSDDMNWFD